MSWVKAGKGIPSKVSHISRRIPPVKRHNNRQSALVPQNTSQDSIFACIQPPPENQTKDEGFRFWLVLMPRTPPQATKMGWAVPGAKRLERGSLLPL